MFPRLGAQLILTTAAVLLSASPAEAENALTARQVVERIKSRLGVPWEAKTIDTFKAGDPDAKVTGIATTFLATQSVLERAAARGLNLIITHEPTFYNHRDETRQLEGDPIYEAKRRFIERHGLVVWRFHDHWHRRRPDGILEGVVRKLGWQDYQRKDEPRLFTIPETTAGRLTETLRLAYGRAAIRLVGDPGMKCTRVAVAPGAAGSKTHIAALRRDDVEVLIVGEAREWETVEYVRDAAAQGKRKALILLGHVISEEPGMENCARWLRTFITEVPVEFIPAGDPFWQP